MNIEALVFAKVADADCESKGEQFRQAQKLLGFNLVRSTSGKRRLKQPKLKLRNNRGHLPGKEEVPLRLRGAKDFPIYHPGNELLRRFLDGGSITPCRFQPSLYLSGRDIVLKC